MSYIYFYFFSIDRSIHVVYKPDSHVCTLSKYTRQYQGLVTATRDESDDLRIDDVQDANVVNDVKSWIEIYYNDSINI